MLSSHLRRTRKPSTNVKQYRSNRATLAEQTAPRLMPYVPLPNEEDCAIANATRNAQKCEFGKTSITFLGHKIDHKGIQADPDKTRAIRDMKGPKTVSELHHFLGMVNQLGKFTPHLAHLTHPLRGLLSKDTAWVWGPDQRDAFTRVKEELSKPTTLALYDSQAPTRLSADASSYGLGAVLLQQTDGKWRPVAYASRSMADTERRYAQIEKEALAITWACEKFAD